MRHIEICRKTSQLNADKESTIIYYITVDQVNDADAGIDLENYGVGVTIAESGETKIIPNITFSKTEILLLAALLATHLVTPVTVGDVVEDWLGGFKPEN